jgi:hypothetical protein
MLPSRALRIIHEYSRPITRADWRHSKPIISTYQLYLFSKSLLYLNQKRSLAKLLYMNISYTEWYIAYLYMRSYGIRQAHLNEL